MSEEKKDEKNKEAVKTEKNIEVKIPSAEELLGAGVHFGHKTSRWNPKMKPYIFGARNGVHILDLEKTLVKLKDAAQFAAQTAQKGGLIVFVGTKPVAKKIMKETAQNCGMPYVIGRWLGGTLTNFKTIGRRLEYFRDLERQMAEGELKKYTKKEQLGFARKLAELEKNFGGIKNLVKLPEAVFILDIKEDRLVVNEAKKAGVKIIAICDTNTNPEMIDWPIPGNDDAVSAVKIIADTIADAIKENR